MKIKGKSKNELVKAFHRVKDSNPIKAGYIKNYLRVHYPGVQCGTRRR